MRVLYDFQAFSLQRFGGVSRCFAELASNMPDDISAEVAILESDNVYLKEKGLVPALKPLSISRQSFLGGVDSPAKEFLFNALNYVPFAHTPKTVNRAFSIKRLESGEFDVFHPTFFDGYFLPHLHGTPFVLTVHDLTVDRMYDKGDKAYRQVVDRNRLLDRAARIVAVSGNTADDLVSLAGVDRNRISVIYHGAPDVDLDALRLQKPAVDGRYLLFVGSRSVSYKNFRPFVRALMPLLSKHKDLKVVCTGAGFDRDEQAFFIQCGVSDRMLHLSASSDVLYNLYHNASAFVFPSSYEGFGLPILESFACACPAILNRASCFPEIAGDAALWFDMLPDSDNLTEVLDDFLTNRDSIAPGLVSKGLDRLRMFSWKESAARLASVYRSCL